MKFKLIFFSHFSSRLKQLKSSVLKGMAFAPDRKYAICLYGKQDSASTAASHYLQNSSEHGNAHELIEDVLYPNLESFY